MTRVETTDAAGVGIVGAGTMGAGIAQVAASHGWTVRLMDVDAATVERAIDGVRGRLDRLVTKGRMTPEQRHAAARRLQPAATPAPFADCELVIEAIVEDLDVKSRVLRGLLPELGPDTIIATNTSSLSVSALGRAIAAPRRTVGMHFFNPAPVLRLVEVVAGDETDPDVVDRVADIATAWDKRVARARDVPGFIVNHVARPYYLEAFRILEDGFAPADVIDRTMTRLGGFRMGPLELTDLIGQDVNAATSRSVWEQLERPPLLRPSRLQEQLVADGHLGRKAGRGVYRYDGDTATVAVRIAAREQPGGVRLRQAMERFTAAATGETGTEVEQYVLARVLVAVFVQAGLARERGVAGPGDIDTALRYGTNYPRGPFEWSTSIGPDLCAELLAALNETVTDGRFAIPAARSG